MKKGKEWLKEEFKELKVTRLNFDEVGMSVLNQEFVSKKEVRELIDQLEQPAVPEIPDYVAEYLSESKKRKTLYAVLDSMPKRVSDWVLNQKGFGKGQEIIARAWLDGYTVAEKKYYVMDKKNMVPLLAIEKGVVKRAGTHLPIGEKRRDTLPFQLTEQEIKDYDERYWAFKEEVAAE